MLDRGPEVVTRLLLSLYLLLVPFSITGMWANMDWRCEHEWPHICDARSAKEDVFFGAFVGFIVPISFMVTSGWEDGFRIGVRPSSLHGGEKR